MEQKNIDDNFETFLQQKIKQHRMFAPDHIWRNIHQELHGKRKWPALTITAVLLLMALCTTTFLNNASIKLKNYGALKNLNKPFTLKPNISKYNQINNNQKIITAPIQPKQKNNANINSRYLDNTTLYYQSNNHTQIVATPILSEQLITFKKLTIAKINTNAIIATHPINFNSVQPIQNKKIIEFNNTCNDEQSTFTTIQNNKKIKAELELYFTPSISFRKLQDDQLRNNFIATPAANNSLATINTKNINEVVRHKPALGLELGIGVLYPIHKNLKVKIGLQYNLRKYYIDSYHSGITIANIAVIRNNSLDTIRQITNLSTNAGFEATKLNTKLYQVSVPLGLSWNIVNGKKLALNIAGSLEPTLTLNKNVYLISTDYNYYTDGTPFLRKWNINSSANINISYKIGKIKVYGGPQIRYQHLPTYNEQYPINEYRMDYGFRIGFTK